MHSQFPQDPTLSLVVSVYGVEAYLDAFLASLEAQGASLARAEVIFIDDGSPDRCAEMITQWLARTHVTGQLVRQPNGGVAAARNTGLPLVRGRWVSFPDPDDVLDTGYLAAALEVLDAPAMDLVVLVATNLIYLDDQSGTLSDTHPLREPFRRGRRVIDLAIDPQSFRLSGATAFLRADAIRAAGLSFDVRVTPNFEDGSFIARYLLEFERPLIAVVPDARYLYRRRWDASSLVASSWARREKYTEVPRHGWLDTLEYSVSRTAAVPQWLQYAVLYDLQWYFAYDGRIHTPTKGMPADVKAEFLRIVSRVLAYLDESTIADYSVTDLSVQIRVALLVLRGGAPGLGAVNIWRADARADLVLVKYYFAGQPPHEEFRSHGRPLSPSFAKSRAVTYFDATIMHERVVWIRPSGSLSLHLEGAPVELRLGAPTMLRSSFTRRDFGRRFGLSASPVDAETFSLPSAGPGHEQWLAELRRRKRWRDRLHRWAHGRGKLFRIVGARFTKTLARSTPYGRRFRDGWILMDRDVQAQDNAEHLFRWIRANRPMTNAWFVIAKGTADWKRLKSEGFRLVAHGSLSHRVLLLNATQLLSSHVDDYVVNPLDRRYYGAPKWSYTFLQHGVTKDDISRWLNPKPIRRIITTSAAEQAGFVADSTPYSLTERESVLTGFPRHDALLAKARGVAPENRRLMVVMPTWREYLLGPPASGRSSRPLRPGLESSEYARAWGGLLQDRHLRDFSRRRGLELVFVPHPNLEPHLAELALPDGISVFRYSDGDIQDVIARAAVLLTDYSSLAFEAAHIHTPVVYFQFDREDFFAGHPHRAGYFDYEQHGFGPVTTTVEAAVSAITRAIDDPPTGYRERADGFYAFRDGESSRRVYEAVAILATAGAGVPDTDRGRR